MLNVRNYILLFLLIAVSTAYAQDDLPPLVDPMFITVKAKIISAADSVAVPYANIVNNRTHSGTITNSEGIFTLEMLNIDTLVVSSVGFQKSVIKIPYNYTGNSVLTFIMKPVNYALGEIEIKGERQEVNLGFETGKPTAIAPELRGDAFNENPPVIAALFNPISYWQYYLSKKEIRKRKVRETMAVTKNWEMHSKNYNKEMVMKLTGLKKSEADTFMVWFNGKNVLPYTSSEYQVRASIIEYFQIYQYEQQLEK